MVICTWLLAIQVNEALAGVSEGLTRPFQFVAVVSFDTKLFRKVCCSAVSV